MTSVFDFFFCSWHKILKKIIKDAAFSAVLYLSLSQTLWIMLLYNSIALLSNPSVNRFVSMPFVPIALFIAFLNYRRYGVKGFYEKNKEILSSAQLRLFYWLYVISLIIGYAVIIHAVRSRN